MTLTWLAQIIGSIETGTHAFVSGKMGNGWYLKVTKLIDNEIQTGRKWYISKHTTESEVVLTALKALITFEEHEIREKFLYQGHAIFHPHPDIDSLIAVARLKSLRDK